MPRFLILALLTAVSVTAAQTSSPSVSGQEHTATFNRDVLPILQRDCQVCHRPGEVAPMSFLTYESTRPWAKAMKQAVVSKKMPPWFADTLYGDFRNAPKLTPGEVNKIAAWADSGAPEGDAQDKPAPIPWPDGWRTKPDVIISMPAPHNVGAKGSGEIEAFLIPNPFKEDTWVTAIEVRPGNPSVVHHVLLQTPDEAPQPVPYYWGGGAPAATCVGPSITTSRTTAFSSILASLDSSAPSANPAPAAKPPKNFAILEAIYVPGSPPMDFGAYDSAELIPGGGNLRLEVHYTPHGKATSDLTRVGFTLAKKVPQKRFVTLAPKSLANTLVRIPAGASNWETRGDLEFGEEAQLVWLMPHMHLRGKDMAFQLVSPNGYRETLLNARFNFDWQLGYEFESPLRMRRGARLAVVAHHDNSANNPYNPAPDKEVEWGTLTAQEMVLPWFGVVVDKKADPERILAVRGSSCSGLRDASALPELPSAGPLRGTPLPLPIPTLPRIKK